MKEKINEHDMTKKMMEVIRGGFKTKLITEVEQSSQDISSQMKTAPPQKQDDSDTITPKKGDAVYNAEYEKLSETVDPSIDITNFKLYPVDKNAIIEGTLLNNRATFKMELTADEVVIDTGNIGLNDETSETLKKLQGYFKNWKNEWAKKITTEYNQKQD